MRMHFMWHPLRLIKPTLTDDFGPNRGCAYNQLYGGNLIFMTQG